MSKAILIIGESGAGKTTSMRELPPDNTFYVDCDGKGLSWKGWRKQFNKESKNYFHTEEAAKVLSLLSKIDKEQLSIKFVVIDTLNALMIADEQKRRDEKTFDKWADLAYSILDIIKRSSKLREDLTVICIAHSQTEYTEDGFVYTKMKTNGKKLNKIVPESYFTTVLLAKCSNGKYIFETHANNSTAKTPMGAFEENEIENNITNVIKVLKEY